MAAWTGCVAGALTEREFRAALADAGLEDVEVRETHQVDEHVEVPQLIEAARCYAAAAVRFLGAHA